MTLTAGGALIELTNHGAVEVDLEDAVFDSLTWPLRPTCSNQTPAPGGRRYSSARDMDGLDPRCQLFLITCRHLQDHLSSCP